MFDNIVKNNFSIEFRKFTSISLIVYIIVIKIRQYRDRNVILLRQMIRLRQNREILLIIDGGCDIINKFEGMSLCKKFNTKIGFIFANLDKKKKDFDNNFILLPLYNDYILLLVNYYKYNDIILYIIFILILRIILYNNESYSFLFNKLH